MRIPEDHPFGGQPVHVRSQSLRIALQHARPVIEIIDRDEQNVWFRGLVAGVICFTAPDRYAKQKN